MIGPWLVVGLAVAAAVAGGYGLWLGWSRRRRSADPVAASLKRAEQAVDRLRAQTRTAQDPTLRAQLDEVDDKATEVLADLHRFAAQLPAIDKGRRDIPVERLRAEEADLAGQVERADDPTLRAELEHAHRSCTDQLAVADRLDAARETLLARIEAAVLDLEGLGHRVAEIVVMHDSAGEDPVAGARLTELSDDVSGMRAGLAEAQGLSESILGTPPQQPRKKARKTAVKLRKPGKRARWDIVIGVVAVVLVVSCLLNAFIPRGRAPLAGTGCVESIGFMGRLSGDDAGDAQTEYDAAALAVEQDNAAHPACRIQLQRYDTNIGDNGAEDAANAVVADDGVLGIIGPTYGSDVEGALPVLSPAGIAVISPSASNSKLPTLGWRVFHRTLPSDDDQADAAARYLKGRKTFVVGDDTEFGKDVSARVAGEVTLAGRANVTSEQKDFASVVRTVTGSGADAVYFGGIGDDGGLLVKALRAAEPKIIFVGGDRLIASSFFDGAGDAAEGTVATCPCVSPKAGVGRFHADFQARYRTEPGFYAPEAYDAARILVNGIRAGHATRDDLLAWVDAYDADGITRHLRFGPGGGLAGPGLNVWAYTVRSGTFTADSPI
jgi:branched-chain amino acid transport system substrate-binding protein